MRRVVLLLAALSGLIAFVFVACVVFLAIDSDSTKVYRNVTGAMDSTLLAGERFTTQSIRPLEAGDLVIHEFPPNPANLFVKRVVGMPGDTIAMRDGRLERNGRAVVEAYAWSDEPEVDPVLTDFDFSPYRVAGADTVASRSNWGPFVVPRDSVFVLGDNRDNSLDSRYWGFLGDDRIVGLPRRVYFSRDPETGRIRWSRMGRLLR